eukprot:TRINITY_DN28042_c0_g1_i1.p1 TRINITY_DN28042_c0_g1~~TRINITY_DN28042_c0_g1_i1.p1  ORF type:complete len:923 (+),score=141.05 TRINITY_DN28042_c0_g1_i1:53-2821(+)
MPMHGAEPAVSTTSTVALSAPCASESTISALLGTGATGDAIVARKLSSQSHIDTHEITESNTTAAGGDRVGGDGGGRDSGICGSDEVNFYRVSMPKGTEMVGEQAKLIIHQMRKKTEPNTSSKAMLAATRPPGMLPQHCQYYRPWHYRSLGIVDQPLMTALSALSPAHFGVAGVVQFYEASCGRARESQSGSLDDAVTSVYLEGEGGVEPLVETEASSTVAAATAELVAACAQTCRYRDNVADAVASAGQCLPGVGSGRAARAMRLRRARAAQRVVVCREESHVEAVKRSSDRERILMARESLNCAVTQMRLDEEEARLEAARRKQETVMIKIQSVARRWLACRRANVRRSEIEAQTQEEQNRRWIDLRKPRTVRCVGKLSKEIQAVERQRAKQARISAAEAKQPPRVGGGTGGHAEFSPARPLRAASIAATSFLPMDVKRNVAEEMSNEEVSSCSNVDLDDDELWGKELLVNSSETPSLNSLKRGSAIAADVLTRMKEIRNTKGESTNDMAPQKGDSEGRGLDAQGDGLEQDLREQLRKLLNQKVLQRDPRASPRQHRPTRHDNLHLTSGINSRKRSPPKTRGPSPESAKTRGQTPELKDHTEHEAPMLPGFVFHKHVPNIIREVLLGRVPTQELPCSDSRHLMAHKKYVVNCTRWKVKPNSRVIECLRSFTMKDSDQHCFDFEGSFVGDRGVVCLLHALAFDPMCCEVSFRDCGLRGASAPSVAAFLELHPQLRHLDLSQNNISFEAGKLLLDALNRRSRGRTIDFSRSPTVQEETAGKTDRLVAKVGIVGGCINRSVDCDDVEQQNPSISSIPRFLPKLRDITVYLGETPLAWDRGGYTVGPPCGTIWTNAKGAEDAKLHPAPSAYEKLRGRLDGSNQVRYDSSPSSMSAPSPLRENEVYHDAIDTNLAVGLSCQRTVT